MSQELVTIEAKTRDKTGKGYARKLRSSGMIPANLLNKGKSTMLELDPKLLSKAWQGGKKFNLKWNGETKPVVITDLQINVVKRLPLHVDLQYAN